MSALGQVLIASLDAEDLAALRDLLGIGANVGSAERRGPWLKAPEAAAYLCCPESRIRKLTMTGELPVHRDGRRCLYDRRELDEFIRNGGASTP